ncbi:hypothetical protein JMJ77_0014693 [Colletotrichum scovillei]|uniref:Uncharacterized protein n=1 Tax=Colletotrichum scovillei TaxID=1209932 RepID=A0A9P7U9Q3_9PEZI|nr:hypothetical protein JMJ77_0014693 [Colletotrichum scovillei]KAG7056327.1 hypothetical protein JMJ78_0000130 [Colletotrichum scovillei]KAG7066232.1 hypothetical protein JMJ76_0000098 [Colletotrichum scovillei]
MSRHPVQDPNYTSYPARVSTAVAAAAAAWVVTRPSRRPRLLPSDSRSTEFLRATRRRARSVSGPRGRNGAVRHGAHALRGRRELVLGHGLPSLRSRTRSERSSACCSTTIAGSSLGHTSTGPAEGRRTVGIVGAHVVEVGARRSVSLAALVKPVSDTNESSKSNNANTNTDSGLCAGGKASAAAGTRALRTARRGCGAQAAGRRAAFNGSRRGGVDGG